MQGSLTIHSWNRTSTLLLFWGRKANSEATAEPWQMWQVTRKQQLSWWSDGLKNLLIKRTWTQINLLKFKGLITETIIFTHRYRGYIHLSSIHVMSPYVQVTIVAPPWVASVRQSASAIVFWHRKKKPIENNSVKIIRGCCAIKGANRFRENSGRSFYRLSKVKDKQHEMWLLTKHTNISE